MPNTNNNLVNPNNLFALENAVMADLTDFNKKYRLYVTCANTGNQNRGYFNKSICPTDVNSLRSDLDTAYAKLTNATNGSLVILQKAIDNLPQTTGGIDQSQYIQNYYDIMNKYKDVLSKRQALDSSLAELYEIGDTSTNFYEKKLMSTSYTKIILTILATTLTVGAFMTMRNK